MGKAITLGLARAGANVIVHYHSSAQAAEETAAEARKLGVQALAVCADLSRPEQVQACADQALEQFGTVDILVNSGSLFVKTPFPTPDPAAWQQVMRVLVDGAFLCANAFAPGMLSRGEGAIINIVDLSVWQPWPGFGAHSVGKSALLALTRQLALELAPSVRVNAVAPGAILPPPHYGEAQIARAAARTLLKRWGRPDDVAQAVVFLAQADFITGEVLTVDGGERISRRS